MRGRGTALQILTLVSQAWVDLVRSCRSTSAADSEKKKENKHLGGRILQEPAVFRLSGGALWRPHIRVRTVKPSSTSPLHSDRRAPKSQRDKANKNQTKYLL